MTLLMMAQILGCDLDVLGESSDTPSGSLTMDEPWPWVATAGDSVYIWYSQEAKQVVRATPAGVSALDIGARAALWIEATPDGSLLHVLADGATGIEHVFVKDDSIAIALPGGSTNRMTASPNGQIIGLWYDAAMDAHSGGVVDVRVVTFVDTATGTWTDIATGMTPKDVVMSDETALIVADEGAVSVELATQTVLQSYDFASEKVEGFEGFDGVLSADGVYGLIGETATHTDERWVRVGLADHSVDVLDEPFGTSTDASTLFTVGEQIFAHAAGGGLAAVDVTSMTIDTLSDPLDFDSLEVVGNTAVFFSDQGPITLLDAKAGTVTPYAMPHQDDAWVREDFLIARTFVAETWVINALDLGTGWSTSVPLPSYTDTLTVGRAGSDPVLMMYLSGVDDFVLLPLADGAEFATGGPKEALVGTMANGEAFYGVAPESSTGRVRFVDPVTGAQTVYDDLTSLGILTDPR